MLGVNWCTTKSFSGSLCLATSCESQADVALTSRALTEPITWPGTWPACTCHSGSSARPTSGSRSQLAQPRRLGEEVRAPGLDVEHEQRLGLARGAAGSGGSPRRAGAGCSGPCGPASPWAMTAISSSAGSTGRVLRAYGLGLALQPGDRVRRRADAQRAELRRPEARRSRPRCGSPAAAGARRAAARPAWRARPRAARSRAPPGCSLRRRAARRMRPVRIAPRSEQHAERRQPALALDARRGTAG